MTTTLAPPPASARPTSKLGPIEVHALTGDRALISIPTGDQFRVGMSAQQVRSVLLACSTGRDLDEILDDETLGHYRSLLELLINTHTLQALPAASDAIELLLIGDTFMAEALERHLRTWNCRVSRDEALSSHKIGTNTVVVWVSPTSDTATGLELNTRLAATGTRWVPVELRNCHLFIGPAIRPGYACDYEDLTQRRRAAAGDLAIYEATTGPAVFSTAAAASAELDWALSAAAAGIEQWLTGRPTIIGHGVMDVDLLRLDSCLHPLLPLPHKNVERPERMAMALVDPEQGIVLRARPIKHSRAVPASLTTVQTDVACMERIYPWPNNTTCQGSTFGAPAEAREAAIGEAVERYCANLLDTLPRVVATYDELASGGESALDPTGWFCSPIDNTTPRVSLANDSPAT